MNKRIPTLKIMALSLLLPMTAHATDFHELEAWLMEPEPFISPEEQAQYERELQMMIHDLQQDVPPVTSAPATQNFETPFVLLNHEMNHHPLFTFTDHDVSLKEVITICDQFIIEGPTALAIKNACTSFEAFKAIFGKFTENPTMEQMKFEVGLHLFNVSTLKHLGIYQRPHYGQGACLIQMASRNESYLSNVTFEYQRRLTLKYRSLNEPTYEFLQKIHSSMKKKLSGTQIIFRQK